MRDAIFWRPVDDSGRRLRRGQWQPRMPGVTRNSSLAAMMTQMTTMREPLQMHRGNGWKSFSFNSNNSSRQWRFPPHR